VEFDYELVVIGGGPAGEKGAAQAAYFGHKTALIEKEAVLGGACINTGTLPSKTLRETALFLSGFKARQLYGLETGVKRDIRLADFMHRKNLVQERERERASLNLQRHGIERIFGTASLRDAHSVVVRNEAGEDRVMTGKFILIATGSSPHRPVEVPFNGENVFDSDSVLEMKEIPPSMIVVGGGVIGCEYACLFAALGLAVWLIEGREQLLPFLDREIADALLARMKDMGIEVLMPEALASTRVEGKEVITKLKSGREIVAESMLYAAGRSGNTSGLGLDKLGIAVGKRGHVEVDGTTYQAKLANAAADKKVCPSVYAAGDVVGFPALASTSMEQGRIAVCHMFDLKYKTKLAPILPLGIYTIPEVSCVGETEESCVEKKISYVSGKSRFGQHARGQIMGETDGMIKLIFSSPEGKLLGVHVIGEIASELVHVGLAALHFGADVDFFVQSVFNYPTLGDVYKYAAYDALGKLNVVRKSGQ
jgi:NAD(P) transhydrogenase